MSEATGTANDWLITPQINIPGGVANLSMSFSVAWFSTEVLDVKISTTTKDTTAFASVGGSPVTLTGDGGSIADLSVTIPKSASNRNFYFAFVNRSKGGDQMWITNVSVQGDYPTGIEDVAVNQLQIFPNPATDYITVADATASRITVSDLSGRVVYQQAMTGDKETIAVSSWAKGIYLVTVQTGNNKTVSKIVKK